MKINIEQLFIGMIITAVSLGFLTKISLGFLLFGIFLIAISFIDEKFKG